MNTLVLTVLVVAALYLLTRMFLNRPSVSPNEANAAVQSGAAVVVDVREPSEWQEGVAAPAALLPLSDLRGPRKNWKPFLEKNRGKRILVYCHSGGRSGMAASALKSEGFDAANIGGFSDWVTAGLPVRRP